MLYALCGISGVGKTTILNRLLQREPALQRLVTTTTRAPRPEEVNHVDYHFISQQQFQAGVHAGQLVCPICYRGHWYGTDRETLLACRTREVLGILRPDKLPPLQAWTPLLALFLSWAQETLPVELDDQIIVAHQKLCQYHIVNVPGQVEQAVEQILDILHTPHAGGTSWNSPLLPA